MDEYQALGIVGMVFGIVLLVLCRRVADLFAALQRAQADVTERAVPRRGREIASIWLRVGTGDDAASKAYRYGIVALIGLASFLTGLAALLGAWGSGRPG